ncbi:hypothetical protein GQR36_20195 [Enterococcus termitis]
MLSVFALSGCGAINSVKKLTDDNKKETVASTSQETSDDSEEESTGSEGLKDFKRKLMN